MKTQNFPPPFSQSLSALEWAFAECGLRVSVVWDRVSTGFLGRPRSVEHRCVGTPMLGSVCSQNMQGAMRSCKSQGLPSLREGKVAHSVFVTALLTLGHETDFTQI